MGDWLYFGCGDQAGHYPFAENGYRLPYNHPLYKWMTHLDGTLPPQPERHLYLASFTRIGGVGMSALSWWDRSRDKRPGSNSTVLAPDLDIAERDMLDEAHRRFPWVFNRLPAPLRLLSDAPTPALNTEGREG